MWRTICPSDLGSGDDTSSGIIRSYEGSPSRVESPTSTDGAAGQEDTGEVEDLSGCHASLFAMRKISMCESIAVVHVSEKSSPLEPKRRPLTLAKYILVVLGGFIVGMGSPMMESRCMGEVVVLTENFASTEE
jgi:hypothetical protein